MQVSNVLGVHVVSYARIPHPSTLRHHTRRHPCEALYAPPLFPSLLAAWVFRTVFSSRILQKRLVTTQNQHREHKEAAKKTKRRTSPGRQGTRSRKVFWGTRTTSTRLSKSIASPLLQGNKRNRSSRSGAAVQKRIMCQCSLRYQSHERNPPIRL